MLYPKVEVKKFNNTGPNRIPIGQLYKYNPYEILPVNNKNLLDSILTIRLPILIFVKLTKSIAPKYKSYKV
ncbi:MAG TPA: hypothetical protein PK431_07975 [Chitinophagales bacterium]|nr:hypothetical protein [Chitinophagales bacterium]